MHGYKFMVNLIIDFDKFQSFHAIVSPIALHHSLFTWWRCQSMDMVMGKHGRMYATTTLFVRGDRRWQASSTVGVMKSCWNLWKLGVEESKTLSCSLNFKDCNKGMQSQMWLIHKTCGRIRKEIYKTRGMPPIELGHRLKCRKKHLRLLTIWKGGSFAWE
jgi:hypothetical protein